MPGLFNFSINKFPKRAFRARPPQLFKRQASKTSISWEASSTFQATSFQNEHFVRGPRNVSSNKLPKRGYRARPPQLFKRQASKTSISCEASATFQATSFQNGNVAGASHEMLVLKACCLKSCGSLARNARFGSLSLEKLRRPRTISSFWKLVA